jgi:3-phenylpropionate/cinnamic acid dioxygenase small subunit
MSARAHIDNTLYRYAWTMDRDLLDEIAECFTVDARVDFDGVVEAVGREAITAELSRRRARYRETDTTPWHVITNTYITEETESTATARSFFLALQTTRDGAPTVSAVGYYDDRFVDEGDAWRIEQRRVVGARSAAAELSSAS